MIGWMQKCSLCDAFTSKLVNIDLNDNDNKIYFYVCAKCLNEFNSYNYSVKNMDNNIFTSYHIDYKKLNNTNKYY